MHFFDFFSVVVDFCKLAIDFLQNGVNEKLCSVAAQKLNIEQTVVQNCVYGLVNLLLLACKHRVRQVSKLLNIQIDLFQNFS